MTIITRYSTAPVGTDVASLPRMAWESGLNPNRRWVPGALPAVGAAVSAWISNQGDSLSAFPDGPVVAAEAGVKYAGFTGANGNRLTVPTVTALTMRTMLIIARPNTGDAFFTTATNSPICNTTDIQMTQSIAADVAAITNGVATLAAARDHWHMYAYSIPDSGAGVFVVDNNDTTFTPAARNQTQLNLARSGSNYRQLRILEVITSADVFTAAQLKTAYARAKAWYPGLTW